MALLVAAALAVPAAHAYKIYSSSHRYFQQHAADAGGVSIYLNVDYAKRTPNGKSTPRKVFVQFKAPVSCQVGGPTAASVQSGPFKLRDRKVEFSGSFTNQAPPASNPNPGSSGTFYATGRLIKKKNKRNWRIDGTVTVLTYSSPPTFLNCASGDIPFSATQCWSSAPAWGHPPFCTDTYSTPAR